LRRGTLAGVVGLTAVSCGPSGGGGSSPQRAPSPAPAPVTAASWQPGVYEPASGFKNRCEAPRSGTDPDGNPWPDRPGSTTVENFWLRSWTNETYLWNDEVPDRDPAAYDDRLEYFGLLRTPAVTSSGAPKDNFHFSQPTEEFLKQRNSVPTASYGASFKFISDTPPRDIRVRYVDPGTPAAEVVDGKQQLKRGMAIVEIDGIDVQYGENVDGLNAGLFPQRAGEQHTLRVAGPNGEPSRLITLTARDLARKPVNRTRIINTDTGKIGYILFNTFSPFAAEREIFEAMSTMQTEAISDLVLDLRYNGGGLLAVSSQLGYMIAGPAFTQGKAFERLRFNDDAGGVNPVTGETDNTVPFYDETLGFSTIEGIELPTLNLPRVFVLTTDRTCSASEALINGLRGVGVDVVQIGGTTCGKPFGFYPEDNCGETYYTIQFQGVNDRGFGDYQNGFAPAGGFYESVRGPFAEGLPGCAMVDELRFPLGDETEPFLAGVLQYRRDGTCLTQMLSKPQDAPKIRRDPALAVGHAPGLMEVNRDMRMPEDLGL
jgi:C-terminal processing protease CtpA/Prc